MIDAADAWAPAGVTVGAGAVEVDGMSDQDAINILRAGVIDPAEWENGRWRYRARTARIAVIVQFETELRLITAWRYKR